MKKHNYIGIVKAYSMLIVWVRLALFVLFLVLGAFNQFEVTAQTNFNREEEITPFSYEAGRI
jgi:hypothetical protein